MPDNPTPCPACSSPCRHHAGEEGTQSAEAVAPCPEEQTARRCGVCGGEDREAEIRSWVIGPDDLGYWQQAGRFLLTRLDTERTARQAAEAERDRLRAIARAAAVYVEAIQGVAEAATDAELYRRIAGRAQGYMVLREALAAAGILVYAENNTFTLAEEGAEHGTTP